MKTNNPLKFTSTNVKRTINKINTIRFFVEQNQKQQKILQLPALTFCYYLCDAAGINIKQIIATILKQILTPQKIKKILCLTISNIFFELNKKHNQPLIYGEPTEDEQNKKYNKIYNSICQNPIVSSILDNIAFYLAITLPDTIMNVIFGKKNDVPFSNDKINNIVYQLTTCGGQVLYDPFTPKPENLNILTYQRIINNTPSQQAYKMIVSCMDITLPEPITVLQQYQNINIIDINPQQIPNAFDNYEQTLLAFVKTQNIPPQTAEQLSAATYNTILHHFITTLSLLITTFLYKMPKIQNCSFQSPYADNNTIWTILEQGLLDYINKNVFQNTEFAIPQNMLAQYTPEDICTIIKQPNTPPEKKLVLKILLNTIAKIVLSLILKIILSKIKILLKQYILNKIKNKLKPKKERKTAYKRLFKNFSVPYL